MLPVAYDLFQVSGRVEQEVFSPLIPIYRHGAVYVNTAKTKNMMLCSFPWNHYTVYVFDMQCETSDPCLRMNVPSPEICWLISMDMQEITQEG